MLKVMAKLHDEGYITFTPFCDYSPVDLIAMDSNGKVFRLQVKYRTRNSPTARNKACNYSVAASSMVNGVRVAIDRNMIDGWAIYLADDDKLIFVSVKEFTGGCKNFTGDETGYDSLSTW